MSKNKAKTSKQIFWYNVANYIAYILGFFSFLFIYPNDLEFLGKIKFIETIGHLVYPFLLFGLAQSLVNFNPLLKSYHTKTFFGNSIVFIASISIVFIFILQVIEGFFHLTDYDYYYFGLLLAIALAFIELIKSRAVTLNKVTIPVLLEKVLPKILLPILFFFLYRNIGSIKSLLIAFSYGHFVIVFLMLTYVFRFSIPRFSIKIEHLFEDFSVNDLIKFCFFSLLGSLGSILAFRIENFMIPPFLGFEKNGLYSFAMMFSSLIAIPATGFIALNGPKVSYLVKKNSIKKLDWIYKKTAKKLFFRGFLLYSLLYIIVPDSLPLFVENYHKFDSMIPVINVLGIGILVNIATGFNTEIITYSKYYKFNLLSILVLVIINLSLTFYFLTNTSLELMGVAIASTISICLYNFLKMGFIYKKFGILPIDKGYLKIILIMTCLLIVVLLLPNVTNHLINLVYKSFIIISFNFAIIKRLKLINYKKNKKEVTDTTQENDVPVH